MHSEKRFDQRRAVVTGASSGIGRAIALALAKDGATVALVGRNLDALRRVAEACREQGSVAHCVRADLLVDGDVTTLGEEVLGEFGGIDILVHSAGVIAVSRVAEASLEEFDWQYRCNVRAPFMLTQMLLSSLVARRGQVVFINSTAGLQASAGVSQYSATKHALKAVADSLREELNTHGVRVVSVYLGRTATPMQAEIHRIEGKHYDPERLIKPEQVAEIVTGALAAGREAEITDIRVRPMQSPSGPAPRK